MTDLTPNLERLAAWADDLDSGKYQQCKGSLAADANGDRVNPEMVEAHGLCCLGVAGLTARRLGYTEPINWSISVLDHGLRIFYGLDRVDPVLDRGTCGDGCCDDANLTATNLNDGNERTFPEIAERIRITYGITSA